MEDSKEFPRDDDSIDVTVPMEAQVIQNAQQETSCAHQRLVDDVLSARELGINVCAAASWTERSDPDGPFLAP